MGMDDLWHREAGRRRLVAALALPIAGILGLTLAGCDNTSDCNKNPASCSSDTTRHDHVRLFDDTQVKPRPEVFRGRL